MNVCCFLSKCPIRCVNASNRQRVYHGLVIRYVVEDRKSPSIRVFYRPQQKINWTYWQLLTDEKCMLEQSSNERTEVHTKKKATHKIDRKRARMPACLLFLIARCTQWLWSAARHRFQNTYINRVCSPKQRATRDWFDWCMTTVFTVDLLTHGYCGCIAMA